MKAVVDLIDRRHLSPRVGILLLAAVAVLTFFAVTRPPAPEAWSWAWLGEKFWNMPGGIGALIGTSLGLWFGFRTLIAVQNNQAKIDRDVHAERLEAEKRLLAAGLSGELRAAITIFKGRASVLRDQVEFLKKEARADSRLKEQKIPIKLEPHIEGAFYKANAGKLSLLGADLVKHVTLKYEALAASSREATRDVSYMISTLINLLGTTADSFEKRIPEISDLVRRLEAVAKGEDDPGPARGQELPKKA